MGSLRRWQVGYFDTVKRVERRAQLDAEGEPEHIMQRLKELHPERRFYWIELMPKNPPGWIG
jgi:hypothetical protein